MTVRRVLCGWFAVALAPVCLAQANVSGQVLGTVQATLDHCSQAYPEEAKQFEQYGSLLTREMSPQDLAKLRQTPQFRQAYSSTAETLAKMAKEDLSASCKAALQQ